MRYVVVFAVQAHDAAVKNKQGLGRAAMPKKVAGARWQGKKTKLGSDDEDEQQQQQEEEVVQQQAEQQDAPSVADGREVFTRNGITIAMPVKKVQQQQHQEQQQQQDSEQQHASKTKSGKRKRNKDADAGVQGATAAAADTAVAASKSSSKQSKGSKQQQPGPSAKETAAAGLQKVKWAKLAAKILEGAPKKRMQVQKLHKKVLVAAGFDVHAPGVDTEALYQQMMKKLKKSEGLKMCDKYVAMA